MIDSVGPLRLALEHIGGLALHSSPSVRDVYEVLVAHALLSLSCCIAVFILSNIASPLIFSNTFGKLLPYERKIWHTNMVTFLPAFGVTYFALPAMLTYSGTRYNFLYPASAETIKACGVSLGYMLWDLSILLMDADDQMRAYGGAQAYTLYLVHHGLSLMAWPYAVGRGRCVYFINWFLVSEVTNFNMSLRWFLMKAKLENSKLYLWNGLTWLPLFFCIRVMVIPNLIDALLHSDWEVLTTGEKWTARLLLPIPMLLNTYWWWLILSKAIAFLRSCTMETP